MTAIEIFSSSVNYKYKSRICSLSTFIALIFIKLSLLTPLFLIYNAGGIWIKNRVHVEPPDVLFGYKYLLIVEMGSEVNPIVCSTFATYKGNKITDDCTLIKVQETDTNNDGRKDILRVQARFYTDKPMRSIKLLLFFNFKLKQLFHAVIESIAVFNYAINHDIQKLQFLGDLELHQRGLLRSEGLYEAHNHSIKLEEYSLDEILKQNINKKFSAKITNDEVTWQTGYSAENEVIIEGELHYREYLIYYQPSLWEELKWAWVQYLSCLLVFAYIAKHILIFLFSNRYLCTYIVVPWQNK